MKFGVREIANVVFRAKTQVQIGRSVFKKGQPVLYIDTAKTSTLEGAAEAVYATGGRGNTRLISWEGEKTLTFTVEDALLSPIGFAVLSGAGLFDGYDDKEAEVHFHMTTNAMVDEGGKIELKDALDVNDKICEATDFIYVIETEEDGSLTGKTYAVKSVEDQTITLDLSEEEAEAAVGTGVFVDYYILKDAKNVKELSIEGGNFAGYYYVEADTLFRDENSGKDLPANLTFPNVKIQSDFTFSMASTGDPSTFTFTMDALPGYTYFNKKNKVLCVMQVVNSVAEDVVKGASPYMLHTTGEKM